MFLIKELYILLFLSLHNTLHREETSPAYFSQHLDEIISTPIIRKLMYFEQILSPLEDSNYMSSTVHTKRLSIFSSNSRFPFVKLIRI